MRSSSASTSRETRDFLIAAAVAAGKCGISKSSEGEACKTADAVPKCSSKAAASFGPIPGTRYRESQSRSSLESSTLSSKARQHYLFVRAIANRLLQHLAHVILGHVIEQGDLA